MKATQLDQMREDFIYIKTTKNVTQDKVVQHSEVIILSSFKYFTYNLTYLKNVILNDQFCDVCFFQHLKDIRQMFREKEERYKSLASLDEMFTKLEELQKQMAWALVKSFCFLSAGIFISVTLTRSFILLLTVDGHVFKFQVTEMEKELEPMKEKLQSDTRLTEKYDEKVEEWKVLQKKFRQNDFSFYLIHISSQLPSLLLFACDPAAQN